MGIFTPNTAGLPFFENLTISLPKRLVEILKINELTDRTRLLRANSSLLTVQ